MCDFMSDYKTDGSIVNIPLIKIFILLNVNLIKERLILLWKRKVVKRLGQNSSYNV